MNSSRVSSYPIPGFATLVFIPAHPFLNRCSKPGYEGLGTGKLGLQHRVAAFQLVDVWLCFCSWLSSQLHNATDSEWIFGLSFGVARRLLTISRAAFVYAVAAEAVIKIFAFFILHFIHCLLTVIVWIQV